MSRPGSGIVQIPSGAWRWRIMINGVRYSGTASTAAAARLARVHAEIDSGGTPVSSPMVGDMLNQHIAASKRAETTLANWRWALEHMPESFLGRVARDVKAPIVAALWRQMAGQPPHMLVKTANLCSTAWQDALMLGAVDHNPFRLIAPPTPPRAADIVPPEPADVRRLIDAADPWFRAWLLIAAYTGARGGEVCALQWRDVDLDGGTVMIRHNLTRTGTLKDTKTGAKGQRRVPLDDDALDALKGLREWPRQQQEPTTRKGFAYGAGSPTSIASVPTSRPTGTGGSSRVSASIEANTPSASNAETSSEATVSRPTPAADPSGSHSASRWVFDRGDGHPMRPDGAAKRLARLARTLELDISPHDLRHFAVTQWLEMGVSIPDVAGMIGDNPKTVMSTYAHHIPSNRAHMVRRLAARVRGDQ